MLILMVGPKMLVFSWPGQRGDLEGDERHKARNVELDVR